MPIAPELEKRRQQKTGPITGRDLLELMAMTQTPVVADSAGLVADILRMKAEPQQRTAGNFALAGLGLLPFVPRVRGIRPAQAKTADGLEVLDDIPNTDSISATFTDWKESGVFEIPLQEFNVAKAGDVFAAADDVQHAKQLAQSIARSGKIKPLIVAVEGGEPYILEGSHRLAALAEAGATTFPALVVEAIK